MDIKANYQELRKALDECDGIYMVVDARDPPSFYCPWIIEEMKQRKLPRLSAVVKLDLIPRISANNWIASLDPGLWTVGADLTKPESAAAIVRKLIRDYGEGAKHIACIGAPGVGKTTLCKIIGEPLFDTPGWNWADNNVSLALCGSFKWRGSDEELALAFFARIEDGGYQVLGLTPQIMLKSYAEKEGLQYNEAASQLISKLRSGELKWCVFGPRPLDDSFLWKRQRRILLDSCHHQTEGYIHLKAGEGVKISPELKL